jgi:hypothetical protein
MSKIVDLKSYDLVFTSSFECPHGISGHLYEMIDYFYICSTSGIKSAIFLSDGTSKELLKKAVTDKYSFTDAELDHMMDNTYAVDSPRILMAKNICVVDGSWRFKSCIIYTDNIFLLRCSETEFERFHGHKTIKRAHLMQDFNLYPERFEELDIEVIDYVKKILWTKYIQPKGIKTNTAMFYLTTNCRALPVEDIQLLIDKHSFERYTIVTNFTDVYEALASDKVSIVKAPVNNIFDCFDTYIYTATPLKADCSPRFIVECAVFGKEVIYEIDYVDPGVRCRQVAIEKDVNDLLLTKDDFFVSYVRKYISD